MQFTSIYFVILLAISLITYYAFSSKANMQNIILLATGMLFYGLGHVQYLLIWLLVSSIAYGSGIAITYYPSIKRGISALGVGSIVVLFILLKYSAMLWSTFSQVPESLHSQLNYWLPIGLSFYSFTCIGYILDVRNQKTNGCTNPLQFYAYCGFFPQLLSGPISFADKQLPQFAVARKWNKTKFIQALPVFTWGLFKKVVVANNLSKPVAYLFAHHEHQNPYLLILGLCLYSIQVYADFSGYSDMAYALGKSFQIDLPMNFRMPYFASNIAEYWRRWHSSLSLWLSRYIYYPLGGNRLGQTRQFLNILIVFFISGWWHGTDWKFVWWGVLNGIFYILFLVYQQVRHRMQTESLQTYVQAGFQVPGMVLTFAAVSLARVYFRSASFHDANTYLLQIVNPKNASWSFFQFGWQALLVASFFMLFEWFRKDSPAVLDFRGKHPILQGLVYAFTMACIMHALLQPQTTEHIYFKF